MDVKFGNLYYFFYLGLAVILLIILDFYFKKIDRKKRYKIIIIISFSSLLLHFLKMFFYPYNTDFKYIRKISFENICAVSTLIFPFILLSKNKYLKDYLVVMGLISGFLSLILPLEAYSTDNFKYAFSFDIMRFYYAHFVIFITSFFVYRYNYHELNKKRILFLPIVFLTVLSIIFINEFILLKLNLISQDMEKFFSAEYRNSSFIFGLPERFGSVKYILLIFVPRFLRYIPVVWLVIPSFVYLSFFYYMIFYFKNKEILLFKGDCYD